MSEDRIAPKGAIWVCGACGKSHRDRYGMEGEGSRGWDESCMLHAVLCHDVPKVVDGQKRWTAVDQNGLADATPRTQSKET